MIRRLVLAVSIALVVGTAATLAFAAAADAWTGDGAAVLVALVAVLLGNTAIHLALPRRRTDR
ncbi:hypothetical protein [Polymorphospora rubra]|uniref:Uncharacterized protein n=1 Tax=Polymorphospora rubra TaxID=338584 RepID=A0A810MUD4_9ACTN|nr:hypothetical protein [Polymorphospora rubra]BCJ64130.1 hypothetical protein Prubr_11510 [Polymorphospora rubra]